MVTETQDTASNDDDEEEVIDTFSSVVMAE